MPANLDEHAHVYVERHEDPRKRKRSVPMQILSLGYSRTGTMTMKTALETLEIPTWHWISMAENPPDLALWTETLETKYGLRQGEKALGREHFDKLLGHWGGVTDQPAILFAEELVNAYPEAKVVLIERDPDRWYKSFSAAVIEGSSNPFIPIAETFDRNFIGHMARQTDLIARNYFGVPHPRTNGYLRNNPEYFDTWRANAKDVYRAHNEKIRRITPKDRLLIFKLDDGWKPLCDFLGKPVPDVPFPRVNETAAAQKMVSQYIQESYKRSAKRILKEALPVVLAMVLGILWWRWR